MKHDTEDFTGDWKDHFEEDEGSMEGIASTITPDMYEGKPLEYIAVYDHALSDDELINFYFLEEESDKLAPARGIVYSCLFNLMFWLIVILIVYQLWRKIW